MRGGIRNYFSLLERKALYNLCVFGLFGVLVGLAVSPLPHSDAPVPEHQALASSVAEDAPLRIDVRTAPERELVLLPGIGEKRARDIIAYREEFGLSSPRDLLNVKGIGPKTLANMLPLLVPFGAEADSLLLTGFSATEPTDALLNSLIAAEEGKAPSAPREISPPDIPKTELTAIVNLNSAGIEELCTLPGIGEVKARAIIDFREQNGPFKTIEDITQVKGIGAKTLEKIRHRLSV